jgi:hypothetical protein
MPGSASNIRTYSVRKESFSLSENSDANSVASQKNDKSKEPVRINVIRRQKTVPMNGGAVRFGNVVVHQIEIYPDSSKGSLFDYTKGLIANGSEGKTVELGVDQANKLWEVLSPDTKSPWSVEACQQRINSIVEFVQLKHITESYSTLVDSTDRLDDAAVKINKLFVLSANIIDMINITKQNNLWNNISVIEPLVETFINYFNEIMEDNINYTYINDQLPILRQKHSEMQNKLPYDVKNKDIDVDFINFDGDELPELPTRESGFNNEQINNSVKKINHQQLLSNTSVLFLNPDELKQEEKEQTETEANIALSQTPGAFFTPGGDDDLDSVIYHDDDEKLIELPSTKGASESVSDANHKAHDTVDVEELYRKIPEKVNNHKKKSIAYSAAHTFQRLLNPEKFKHYYLIKPFIDGTRNKVILEKVNSVDKKDIDSYKAAIESANKIKYGINLEVDYVNIKSITNKKIIEKFNASKNILANEDLINDPELAMHIYKEIKEFYDAINSGVINLPVARSKRKWYQFWRIVENKSKDEILKEHTYLSVFLDDKIKNNIVELTKPSWSPFKNLLQDDLTKSSHNEAESTIETVKDEYKRKNKAIPGALIFYINLSNRILSKEGLRKKTPALANIIYKNIKDTILREDLKIREKEIELQKEKMEIRKRHNKTI